MTISKLVTIQDDKPVAGTWLIAQGFGRNHKSILQVINKYRTSFENFGHLKSQKFKSTGGRPVVEYLLTETQTAFLGTLLRNSDQIVTFKEKLVKEFYRMKDAIVRAKSQHKDVEWIENRNKGKVARLEATDSMQEFIGYATRQGSKNADRYYCNITKMMNSMLFVVSGTYKNLRDLMTPKQLAITTAAEYTIDKALKDGMRKKMYYKDVYLLVKERVQTFATLYDKSEIISNCLLTL